jgi:hypothetical protein
MDRGVAGYPFERSVAFCRPATGSTKYAAHELLAEKSPTARSRLLTAALTRVASSVLAGDWDKSPLLCYFGGDHLRSAGPAAVKAASIVR